MPHGFVQLQFIQLFDELGQLRQDTQVVVLHVTFYEPFVFFFFLSLPVPSAAILVVVTSTVVVVVGSAVTG